MLLVTLMGLLTACADTSQEPDLWISYPGGQGQGAGKAYRAHRCR